MKLTHVLNGDMDKLLVFCNENINLRVREFIYKSELHFKTLGALYDGVGSIWFPIIIPEYNESAEFYIIIDKYFEGLSHNWDGENTLIVPAYNLEIYEIEKEVSYANRQRVVDWSNQSERWYLDWSTNKKDQLKPLKEFKYKF